MLKLLVSSMNSTTTSEYNHAGLVLLLTVTPLSDNLPVTNLSRLVTKMVSMLVLADHPVMLLSMNVLTGLNLWILNTTIVLLQDILKTLPLPALDLKLLLNLTEIPNFSLVVTLKIFSMIPLELFLLPPH